jgi:hypothetical protein
VRRISRGVEAGRHGDGGRGREEEVYIRDIGELVEKVYDTGSWGCRDKSYGKAFFDLAASLALYYPAADTHAC